MTLWIGYHTVLKSSSQWQLKEFENLIIPAMNYFQNSVNKF